MITIRELQNEDEGAPKKSAISDQDSFFNIKKEMNNSFCSGYIRRMSFEGINLTRVKLELHQVQENFFAVDGNTVILCFILEGNTELWLSDKKETTFRIGTHNIFYFPSCRGKIIGFKGSHDVFLLSIPFEQFQEFLPTDQSLFCNFKKAITGGKFASLRKENAVIRHKLYQIITDICQTKPDEEVKRLFIRGKVFELLSVQLQNLCSSCDPVTVINKDILEKMYVLKDFMLAHLGEYHSLKNLAKLAGTNEYTLKKEFKELFGDTVFGYWNTLKMEKAQQLLIQQEKSIAEISEIVGYKNPQHFSTAFKRKFKMAPSEFRKNYK